MNTIQKGIPIPPRKGGQPHEGSLTTLMDKLEVGDSFFTEKKSNNVGISKNLLFTKTKIERQFTARVVTEGGVKGIRVWRTA